MPEYADKLAVEEIVKSQSLPDAQRLFHSNYFHDGYYTTHEDVFVACQRLVNEGWTIVAVLPPSRNDSLFSIVASHPTRSEPSFEEAGDA